MGLLSGRFGLKKLAFLQMIAATKASSMSMAETIALLKPQFDDLFPLGSLQKTLAAFQFEMPKIPEAHLAALTAWKADFNGLAHGEQTTRTTNQPLSWIGSRSEVQRNVR